MELENQIIDCEACLFRLNCMGPLVPLTTWENIQLVVVTEKPTKDEDACQWGWGSREARYVKGLIEQLWKEENIHYTYLVKCYPGDITKLGVKNTKTCKELYLKKEIEILKPKIILYLGSLLAKLNGGEFGKFSRRGKFETVGFWQSPSYILNAGVRHTELFSGFLKQLKAN